VSGRRRPEAARRGGAGLLRGALLLTALLACQARSAPEPAQERREPLAAAPPAPASAPAPAPQLIELERPCMGTRCTFAVLASDPHVVEQAVERAVAEIGRLDAMLTSWTDTSEVARINAAAGNGDVVAVSPETYEVLDRSLWIAGASTGAFDITVGAFKGLWKFDEDKDGSLPTRAQVLARLPLVDYHGLVLDPSRHSARLAKQGQNINLGGIAKGLIVDHAVSKLRQSGLSDFVVRAGGDLYASGRHGERPWRVGIQDPRAGGGQARSADTSFALLSLADSAFNTSGDYERFVLKDGKRYHHILDPRTGYPVTHTRSVTVLAPTSFLADTLDTAVFVLGAEKGMQLVQSVPGAEAVIVDAKNQVHVSPGLKDRLELIRPPTDAP
jgi:thiamine biosynthesis lipoprotein